MLFGINQGCVFDDLRVQHMKELASMDLDGVAIGGLAVGETAEEMYRIIEAVEPFAPKDKPRYLMGVGTPVNILESVWRGIDLFDWRHAITQCAAWTLVYLAGHPQYYECQI